MYMRVSLKAARVNSELKQWEVAKILNVSVERIKYLESKEGSSKISYVDLLSLCNVYKCTPDDIFLPSDYPKSEA